jgi:hypothetical protein
MCQFTEKVSLIPRFLGSLSVLSDQFINVLRDNTNKIPFRHLCRQFPRFERISINLKDLIDRSSQRLYSTAGVPVLIFTPKPAHSTRIANSGWSCVSPTAMSGTPLPTGMLKAAVAPVCSE